MRTLEFERRVEAPREVVFSYFVEPEKYVQWQGVGAALDPRPGGEFRVNFVTDRGGARGEYILIDPPERVVFTWGWESPVPIPEGFAAVTPGSSTVEITLIEDGDATIVRLRHAGLPTEEAAELHAGWKGYLERLATVIAGGDPGPDPSIALFEQWRAAST